MNPITETLKGLEACPESINWCRSNGVTTLAEAWERCERGDWMLWLAAKAGVKREVVVFAACQCARTVLCHARGPEALAAIEAAEAWTRGGATIAQVRAAAATSNAYAAAANAAAYAAAAYAAYAAYAAAAAYAAYAAYAAANAYAAYAAANAYAAYAVARDGSRKRSADIVRANIPLALVEEALK